MHGAKDSNKMHFSSANCFKERTWFSWKIENKNGNNKNIPVISNVLLCFKYLEAMEISVDTLEKKNLRNGISIERKNFIVKEFLVFAEAISLMDLEMEIWLVFLNTDEAVASKICSIQKGKSHIYFHLESH